MNTTTDLNAAALSEFDFIVVADASGSMDSQNKSGQPQTRWEAMQETCITMARRLNKIDSDGIGLVVFGGSRIDKFNNVDETKIAEVFASRQPNGGTPLAQALSAAIGLKSDKKAFIVVFTDGVPDDKEAAASVIINQANSQATDDELTILFIQVGNDSSASAYLKSLDDDLTTAKFDIVDAMTQEEAESFPTIIDLIVKAIND